MASERAVSSMGAEGQPRAAGDRKALPWVGIGAALGFFAFGLAGLLAIPFGVPCGALIGAGIAVMRRRFARNARRTRPSVA